MTEQQRPEEGRSLERRANWTTTALVGGVILLILIVAYLATRENRDQDKLSSNKVTSSAPRNQEKLCASGKTYDLIKRELFRRAAKLRGSDQQAYDRLAGYAVVRMENPVMESQDSSTGALNCSGSLSLDLPPGVEVVGGRRTLSSDIDYTVTTAADGSGTVVLLRNTDAIVTPLATLVGVNGPAAPTPQPGDTTNAASPVTNSGALPTSQSQLPPEAGRRGSAGPTADCTTARSRGEAAVCNDAGLAALDRQLAGQYSRALAVASPDQRAVLRDTARRFYAYRDSCPTNACIAQAYTERMNEVRDIMDGQWESQR